MLLWGWACDDLAQAGTLMLCVRPVMPNTQLPSGVARPPDNYAVKVGKPLGGFRANAVIDILIEPLSDNSVRFAFQMSDFVPQFVPSWTISYFINHAMMEIFEKMSEVADKMIRNDPTCEHVALVKDPQYTPNRRWVQQKFEAHAAQSSADGPR